MPALTVVGPLKVFAWLVWVLPSTKVPEPFFARPLVALSLIGWAMVSKLPPL